ncbi:lactosylceramide 4-alpha-galactosyltransferase-like [Sitodiplosis mosellana]|uniref:lactosylceramide 4-alpha-galactosyltransferase-like n=1 Tax=Sitodiplosis mosellana TaxID=263140 RepID=UPI002444E7B8|nr:lactosylceramide 4-alpha-galactosyltransferase-like [Sitodiplosis mosellana]XP_055296582.1 lactosylceramide 4-alpha-galactosyltransferase-like [Sitodiplosis mosellana]
MHFSKLFSLRVYYLTLTIGILVLYTLSVTLYKTYKYKQMILKRKACYQFPNKDDANVDILDDILNAKVKPVEGRSIFFLMTSCSKKGVIHLTKSQACAIESAAFHNPNRNVFVLFASPVNTPTYSQSKHLAVLRSNFTNIYFLNMNLETLVVGTAVEDFYQSDKLFTSKFLVEHMSDFVRLLVLSKYGGIYLDTDCIVQKNLDELPANFLAKEAHHGYTINSVNGAVLGFQDSVGHEILQFCFEDMMENFNPTVWNQNGPALLTRVLESKVCHTSLAEMTPEKCRGFEVFPPEEFYAVNWDNWQYFINPQFTNTVLQKTARSSVIHLWNHTWRNKAIKKSVSEKTAYEALAEKNCPKVYEVSGDHL